MKKFFCAKEDEQRWLMEDGGMDRGVWKLNWINFMVVCRISTFVIERYLTLILPQHLALSENRFEYRLRLRIEFDRSISIYRSRISVIFQYRYWFHPILSSKPYENIAPNIHIDSQSLIKTAQWQLRPLTSHKYLETRYRSKI